MPHFFLPVWCLQSFLFRPIEWSYEHDVLFLREMLVRNVFGVKKGSPARGAAWEAIVSQLKEIHSPKFQLKDKKAVRERWNLLRKKFTRKMKDEEKASRITVEAELTEKESLIEELVDREDNATTESDFSFQATTKRQRDCRRYQKKSDGEP